MYLHRMRCYDRMGMAEHAQADYVKVLEADPHFIQKTLVEKKRRGQVPEKILN